VNSVGSLIGFSEAKEVTTTFNTFNPKKNTQNKNSYAVASKNDINNALKLADEAFSEQYKFSDKDRSIFLELIIEFLIQDEKTLENTYCIESGLSKNRFKTEFSRTINTIRLFSELIKKESWKKISTSISNNITASIEKKRFPIGPVLVFGASNFPLAYSTAGGDSIAAFAVGCPVIVKAHPFHAGTSHLVAKAIIKANKKSNLPEGFFSHIQDNTFEAANMLIKDNRIKAIGFTGSINGGNAIYDIAAKRNSPIPVFCEMGSSNPIIIFENQINNPKNLWANKIAEAICNDAGQFCTKPGLIFIPKSSNGNKFKTRLIHEIINTQACYMLHPSIKSNYEKLIKERIKTSKGDFFQSNEKTAILKAKPSLLCVDINKFMQEKSLQEEVFGPFCVLITYTNKTELKKAIKKLHGQLTYTFIGKKDDFKNDIINIGVNRSGRIIFNDVPTGVQTCSSMHHGGPYPASSDSRFSAVGTDSIHRFTRPVAFQNIK